MRKHNESQLALTALEQYWDKNKHLIFLGNWCQKYARKAHWDKLDYELAPDIWKNPDNIRNFDEYCLDLIESLVNALTNTLNRFHGESHSSKYWKMVLTDWLYKYIYEWYGHYLELINVLDRYPDIEVPILVYPDILHPLNREQIHIKDGRKGDDLDLYHYFIYSQIIKSLSRERSIKLSYQDVPTNFCLAKSIIHNGEAKHNKMKDFIKALYYILSAKAPIVCFDFNAGKDFSKLRRETIGKVCFRKMVKMPIIGMENDHYNLELRKELLIDYQPQDEFERVVVENIVFDLPITALENYKNLIQFRAKEYGYTPKIVIFGGGLAADKAVYMAEWYENGVDFYSTAHAAGHGIFKKNINDFMFMLNCKRYIWGETGDNRTRCCPSFKTYETEMKKTSISKNTMILWCGNAVGQIARYNIFWFPIYKNNSSQKSAINNIQDCLSVLKKELQANLVFRPRDIGGYGIIELFQEYVPDVTIDSAVEGIRVIDTSKRATLYERFSESRLVICESLYSSVFFQALYANIPIIVIETNVASGLEDYLYNDVVSYFNELKRVGIWYESGRDAAVFINENYDKLESWWMEPERQGVCKKVLERFMMSRDDLTGWWKQEFDELLAQKENEYQKR